MIYDDWWNYKNIDMLLLISSHTKHVRHWRSSFLGFNMIHGNKRPRLKIIAMGQNDTSSSVTWHLGIQFLILGMTICTRSNKPQFIGAYPSFVNLYWGWWMAALPWFTTMIHHGISSQNGKPTAPPPPSPPPPPPPPDWRSTPPRRVGNGPLRARNSRPVSGGLPVGIDGMAWPP